MQLNNEQALALVREGAGLLQRGLAQDARARLEQVTRTGRANTQIWLLLASACQAQGDPAGEEAALDSALALDPTLIRGQIMKGDCRVKAGDERGALEFYQCALRWAESAELPPVLAAEVDRARTAVAQYAARGEAEREQTLATRGFPPAARSARFAESLEILAGRKEIFVQRPTGYYFPGLPAIQFFDTAPFDWVPAVEQATGTIRAELDGLLAGGAAGFRPYLHGDPDRARMDPENRLLDSPDWSALFLCESGVRDEAAIVACPRTWAAVQAPPWPRIANSPTVMFSLLRPGARIAPHTGMFNTRLVCHLPLIVPPGCGFRVGNEVREWEEGKLLVFDDSIEHEAWNDSDRDRVVLIFDIWRPDLTKQERAEIDALFAGKLG
ncbi:MAG TPA: aspartyl/asparaginyl beta-hydroxylase domain-containing protein [Novosphingobium sp.]|nr:aspartyl/asparaginyl beta-hydroxylase domain-containing protein [Novosphingobium sp.]